MKKENAKLFIKKYKKEIILVGGIVVFMTVVTILRKALNSKTNIEEPNLMTDDFLPNTGYDIWAMIGTKCSQELLNDIEALLQKENKTIYFEHYESEED